MQVKKQDFGVSLATKSGKDHLPVMCLCKLLLLKTSISHHVSLVERQQVQFMAAAADTEALVSFYELPAASNTTAKKKLWQLLLAATICWECS